MFEIHIDYVIYFYGILAFIFFISHLVPQTFGSRMGTAEFSQ